MLVCMPVLIVPWRKLTAQDMPAKSLELKHTIKLIQELTVEIDEIEAAIKQIMDEEIQSPILSIPGISYRMGAMIIAEIGDFSRFDSADKILQGLSRHMRTDRTSCSFTKHDGSIFSISAFRTFR